MFGMRGFLRREKGFTMMEMIISAGFLAVISILVVQLFITSKSVNRKAYDLDRGTFRATSIIELFKGVREPGQIFGLEPLKDASREKEGDTTRFRLYFDGKWDPVTANEKEAGNREYLLEGTVLPAAADATADEKAGRRFDIRIRVVRIKAYPLDKDTGTELLRLEDSCYFTSQGR